MTTRFLLIAALMVVVAMALVLVPLLRTARREGHPRLPFVLALLVALATPPLVAGIYVAIGTPQALRAAPVIANNATDNHASLIKATQELQVKLASKPDDAQGWALLAQAYSALKQPQQATAALDHLLKLQPDSPNVMVTWVEARAEASSDHLIDDTGRSTLARALALDPTHQRARWLLGISDFQRQQYADAAQQWKTLLPLLPKGSKVAATVQQELTEAEARAGGTTAAAAVAAPVTSAATDATSAVALNVTVQLDPGLADQLKPGDVLYVFARAVDGPAMPLAVAKLHPSRIPVQVTLTNKMTVTPSLDLAQFPQVQVAARISRSGMATPRSGDLESSFVKVAPTSRAPIVLTINHVN